MYSRFAERNSWEYEVIESNAIGIGGFKEIIFSVKAGEVLCISGQNGSGKSTLAKL